MAIGVVSFLFSWCSTVGPGAQLSAKCWLALPHLVSNSSDLHLSDFLSPQSYIIVQSPTQLPTQSLEWHVWLSSSGNNCHAVQRSFSSGASVYECIMGFYLVPFRQPNLPTRFLSITGHWNVSLPSGASLWKWHVWPGRRSIYNTWSNDNEGVLHIHQNAPLDCFLSYLEFSLGG